MDKSIYQQETELFDELINTYPEDLRLKIVADGLCWAAISNELPDSNNNFWPENLWTQSDRRVLFLLKEPNGNIGEDYKDWDWSKKNENFGNILAYWLDGLMRTTPSNQIQYDDLSNRADVFKKYPLAIVNVKKMPGDSEADWCEIREYAHRDQHFLRKQIKSILKPNIIVCCGSNDSDDDSRKMLSIAIDCIYTAEKDKFRKVNNWCYYNDEDKILLIDSFHPSAIGKNEDKVNPLLSNFYDFIVKNEDAF